eukprot:2926356-Ditylum_brightwellii.AAC.1
MELVWSGQRGASMMEPNCMTMQWMGIEPYWWQTRGLDSVCTRGCQIGVLLRLGVMLGPVRYGAGVLKPHRTVSDRCQSPGLTVPWQ